MSTAKEIKGNLARLLATENLIVEHRKVSTASFNVQTRVLTLPLWDKASNTVYDLLVGHEVGHALYTPNEEWPPFIPRDFLNVVEDARIEKLMKRKYPGIAKDFYTGYQELNDEDFFSIKYHDVSTFNLIDRINLYFKIGSYSLIPFKPEEEKFIDLISKAETFEQVIDICNQLVDFVNQNKQDSIDFSGGSDSNSDHSESEQTKSESGEESEEKVSDEFTEDESEESLSDESDDTSYDSDLEDGSSRGGESYDETVSNTQRSFDKSTESLNNNSMFSYEQVYVERADLKLDRIVVDFKDLHPYVTKHFTDLANERNAHWGNIYSEVDSDYQNYKKQSQKEVNYLVKEFECRKSADSYARASVSKTGVLDTKMMYSYKYNDDIFKKVVTFPDGKNHGMIFILDWSGSMNKVLLDTYKQLLNLMWFCKKVQIPFEVYAFTYDFPMVLIDGNHDYHEKSYESSNYSIGVNSKFKLLNVISSASNSKTFEEAALNLWRMCFYQTSTKYGLYYSIPPGFDLSGTPLNETILALHKIIPNFKNKSKAQKISVCILTDGESNGITYDVEINYPNNTYIGSRSVNNECTLRDRKIGRTYRAFTRNAPECPTTIFLENLKDNFPDVNLIGFRIACTSEFNNMYREITGVYTGIDETICKTWKKTKSYEFKDIGYDSLYYIASSSLSDDVDFEVSNNASKNEISKAFRTMLKSKTTNKKILNSFVSVVS